MSSPILFTLYSENDEEKKEYQRSIVPWGILKKAMKLSDKMDEGGISEELMDEMAGLVCEVYGNQFTIEDVNNGADIAETVTVLNAITNKAKEVMPKNQ